MTTCVRSLGCEMSDTFRMELEEDLYIAGWQGFVSAMKNYDPAKWVKPGTGGLP